MFTLYYIITEPPLSDSYVLHIPLPTCHLISPPFYLDKYGDGIVSDDSAWKREASKRSQYAMSAFFYLDKCALRYHVYLDNCLDKHGWIVQD